MDRDDAIRILRRHAGEIRARGVTALALFGSIARGEAPPDSDIDVVVDIEPGRKFSLIDQGGLRVRLSELFGREVDLVIREDLKAAFREEIERHAIQVL